MKLLIALTLSMLVFSACTLMNSSGDQIDRYEIKKTIEGNQKSVQACYDIHLKSNPPINGKMVISWAIFPDGDAGEVTLKENPFKDQIVFNCIAEKLKTWKFPSPPEGQDAVVSYPFIFSKGNL